MGDERHYCGVQMVDERQRNLLLFSFYLMTSIDINSGRTFWLTIDDKLASIDINSGITFWLTIDDKLASG